MIELPPPPEPECLAMFTHADGFAASVEAHRTSALRSYGEACARAALEAAARECEARYEMDREMMSGPLERAWESRRCAEAIRALKLTSYPN